MKRKEALALLDEAHQDFQTMHQKHSKDPSLVRNLKRQYFQLTLKPFETLIYRLGKSNLIKGPLWANTFFDEEMRVFANDQYGRNILLYGVLWHTPDFWLTKYLIKSVGEAEVFYDVGSNYGFYSLLMQALAAKNEIHLFDPCPEVFHCLEETFHGSDHAYLNQQALSCRSGSSRFHYDKKDSGGGTLRTETIETTNKFIEVETSTLDQYVANHKNPTLIKIDVEGAEGKVLEGGERTIEVCRPEVLLELYGQRMSEESYDQALMILEQYEYQPFRITKKGTLELTTFEYCRNPDKFTEHYENMVMKPV